jgi:hypothetical protein
MSLPRVRMLVAAIGSCGAAALIMVAPAWAGAGDDAAVSMIADNGVASFSLVEHAVPCPAGERAIGGGVRGVGSKDSLERASAPLDETGTMANTNTGDIPRYWYSAVFNNTGANQDYQFYAICSASSDATVEVHGFLGAGIGVTTGDAVPCLSGQRAIGGGVSTTTAQPSLGVTSTDDGDIPRFWHAAVRAAAGTEYKVIALCSASSQATIEAAQMTIDDLVVGGNTVGCPAGTRALGGGIGATASELGNLSFSNANPGLGNGDVASAWTAVIQNIAGSMQTYKIFAICEGPSAAAAPALAPSATPAASPTGQRAAALKKCKRKHSIKARKKCKRRARRLPV